MSSSPWEKVAELGEESGERREVPGGWLYRIHLREGTHVYFVKAGKKELLRRGTGELDPRTQELIDATERYRAELERVKEKLRAQAWKLSALSTIVGDLELLTDELVAASGDSAVVLAHTIKDKVSQLREAGL